MAKRQHRSHDQRAAKKARTARHGLSQHKSDGQRAATAKWRPKSETDTAKREAIKVML